jgi:hypothetical protein
MREYAFDVVRHLEYVDLYPVHSPRLANGDAKGMWKKVENVKERTSAIYAVADPLERNIGVSKFISGFCSRHACRKLGTRFTL